MTERLWSRHARFLVQTFGPRIGAPIGKFRAGQWRGCPQTPDGGPRAAPARRSWPGFGWRFQEWLQCREKTIRDAVGLFVPIVQELTAITPDRWCGRGCRGAVLEHMNLQDPKTAAAGFMTQAGARESNPCSNPEVTISWRRSARPEARRSPEFLAVRDAKAASWPGGVRSAQRRG